jgi:hypothetical protein
MNTLPTIAEEAAPQERGQPDQHEQLYLIATVAKVLDSSTKSVRRKIAAGKLAAVRDNGRLKVKGGSLAQHINDMPLVPRNVSPRVLRSSDQVPEKRTGLSKQGGR